jgi:hypothetical protein
MNMRAVVTLSGVLWIAGCSGVFESDLAAPQAYVLRLAPAPCAGRRGHRGRQFAAAAT